MCRGQLQCRALTLVRLLTVKLCLDFVVYLQRAAGHLLSPSRNKKHNCFAVVEAGLWRSGNTSSFGCTVRIWISIPVSNFRRNIFGRAHTGPTSPSCSIHHIALGKFSGGWIPSWSWRAWSPLPGYWIPTDPEGWWHYQWFCIILAEWPHYKASECGVLLLCSAFRGVGTGLLTGPLARLHVLAAGLDRRTEGKCRWRLF